MSMNSWIEGALGAEDMRRRCAAHGAWIEAKGRRSDADQRRTMLFKILATPER